MRHRTAFLISTALSASALAQVPTVTQVDRFDRQLEQIRRNTRLQIDPSIPLDQRLYFDYGAYAAFSYLSADDAQLKNTGMFQYEVGAYADLVIDGANEIFFRGHLFTREFNPGDRFSSDGDGLDGRIDRLFYKFDLARFESAYRGTAPPGNLTFKIGRDLVLWGNGLTLSTEIDGAVIDLTYDAFSLEIIAGVTPIDTVDFDSARPRFDSHTQRGLYGALGSMRVDTHRVYAYGLVQRDYNDDSLTADDMTGGQPSVPTQFDYNSMYFAVGAAGALTDRLSYGVEAVYECGRTLSSSFSLNDQGQAVPLDQQHDDISAYAFDARIDYVIPDAHATRLSAEVLLASGDDDRVSSTTGTYGGNLPGTDDNAFNAFGLPDIGVAFSPSVSNLLMFRVGASTFPFTDVPCLRKMQLGTDLYFFAKLDMDAVIDEPTTNSRWLGFEPDIYMNWQITSDVALTVRYGVFVPGDAIVNDGKMRQFLYTGVTVAF